jgi:hypothetical protein
MISTTTIPLPTSKEVSKAVPTTFPRCFNNLLSPSNLGSTILLPTSKMPKAVPTTFPLVIWAVDATVFSLGSLSAYKNSVGLMLPSKRWSRPTFSGRKRNHFFRRPRCHCSFYIAGSDVTNIDAFLWQWLPWVVQAPTLFRTASSVSKPRHRSLVSLSKEATSGSSTSACALVLCQHIAAAVHMVVQGAATLHVKLFLSTKVLALRAPETAAQHETQLVLMPRVGRRMWVGT